MVENWGCAIKLEWSSKPFTNPVSSSQHLETCSQVLSSVWGGGGGGGGDRGKEGMNIKETGRKERRDLRLIKYTVEPLIEDTLKEDKPPNKGKAEYTHSIDNHL